MSQSMDVMQLTQPMLSPPMKLFIKDNGGIVLEPCVLVGHIVVEEERRTYLDALGINTSWSEFSSKQGRWERCLMSEAVADMLESMHAGGYFPHAFEVGPSLGEVAWLKARARGELERPELPLHDYLIPAPAEALDEVAALSVSNALPISRRRPKLEL